MVKALIGQTERVGRHVTAGIGEVGFAAVLFVQSLYFLVLGPWRRQPVRLDAIVAEMMTVGVRAIPIVILLSVTVGLMVSIQGIYTLRAFGAEHQVVIGVAYGVVREFSPLITAILIAGRSGSALAARIATMRISQELDALTVMGVDPIRFLVAPALVALVIMLPSLSLLSMAMALLGASVYVNAELGLSYGAYLEQTILALTVDDLAHGLYKSVLFAVLITLVAVINGASVVGGAEGVGRMTTRSVVHAISAIVITDMVFVYLATRL